MPYKSSQRPNVTCPLIDNFHVKNILGACEKRQLMFGSRQTVTNYTKTLTLSGLTGGLITQVDHYEVLAQKLNSAILNKTYIDTKTVNGFLLKGDEGVFSLILMVTMPTHPRATPKDAWNYCPYCKFLGFKDIEGSILKDVSLFGGRKQTAGGGTVAVTFADITNPTKYTYGAEPVYQGGGSLKKALVTAMSDDQYQIILTKSTYAGAAVTAPPYPSAITAYGFTLNGDASSYYDILILGQVKF